MDNSNQYSFINKMNYKDIIIIFSIWYFIITINSLLCKSTFNNTPMLRGLFHILFITAGKFLFLSLFIFYFVSLYSLSFPQIGFKFKVNKKQVISTIILIIFFLFLLLLFINISLSYKSMVSKFNPLIKIKSPSALVKSFFSLGFIFLITFIIAVAEMLILNKIVFELFNHFLNIYLAVILSSLFYSILLVEFNPSRILINFIIGLIVLFLYIKSEKSVLASSLFLAASYTLLITYIYGWNYIKL